MNHHLNSIICRIPKVTTNVCFHRRYNHIRRPQQQKIDDMYEGILKGQRASLAQGITLVESTNQQKREQGQELLGHLMVKLKQDEAAEKKQTFRIGFSGAPGAGKSSLIERLGNYVTSLPSDKHSSSNNHVAVLAVDPSSVSTGGSILGDKTRMLELSCNPQAYIRPSPNSCSLGGVTRTTNESIVLCEAAGFNIIFIETVGVGQSEISLSDMVDMFCVVVPPAAGDELQGLKRGIIEVADLVIINKADGDLISAARRAQSEYTSALKLMRRKYPVWTPQVMPVSAKTGDGMERLWNHMLTFHQTFIEENLHNKKRDQQKLKWLWNHVQDQLMNRFRSETLVKTQLSDLQRQVLHGHLSPGFAADLLIHDFFNHLSNKHLTS